MTVPRATYRLQFRNGVTFDTAAALAPYLARLGVSHLYASPIFAAAPGSTHGYDVVDLTHMAPELGGESGFNMLTDTLKREGLELLLDFAPNHMGAVTANGWWRAVLEWGSASSYAQHFDIDWSAPKLIVPALGSGYGEALTSGAFGLSFDQSDGGISFTYGALRLPLTPPSYAQILARLPGDAFGELARRFVGTTPEDAATLKAEFAALADDRTIGALIERSLAEMSGSHDAIHTLHEAQVWRLTHWRSGRETLTYRRFFEIADLVGLTVERPRVFDDVHARLLELIAEGKVAGLRLDHIDGLADPKSYLEKLQAVIGRADPFYVVVEKILGPDEELRSDWPIAGTTGYEFIQIIADALVDADRRADADITYEAQVGGIVDYHALVLNNKRRLLARNLAGELEVLKDMARALAQRDFATRDLGGDTLRRAIIELAAAMPVYRTYVNVSGPSAADREILDVAASLAKSSREIEDDSAIDFLSRMLALDFDSPEDQMAALDFATRFQQTTGPVMAKAVEDTVFYRYNRLIGLNEVGGEPDRFGAPLDSFHARMASRLALQPQGLSATATHDTKRGEDARARLYALSEMPLQWADAVKRWAAMNAHHSNEASELKVPDPEIEWLFYQTLLGAWPQDLEADDACALQALADRVAEFILKAARESKQHTSWTGANPAYEDALDSFVRAALDPAKSGPFLEDFIRTCRPMILAGALNSLTQTLIKLAAPGVPDIYQGGECWDLSLVDPDNRRPVDFPGLERMLRANDGMQPEALLHDWRDGAIKLHLVAAGLAARTKTPALFAQGAYQPLAVEGGLARHIIAFARVLGSQAVIAVAPRQPLALLQGESIPLIPASHWGNTRIALPTELRSRSWRSIGGAGVVEAGDHLNVATLLSRYPVALLASDSAPTAANADAE